MDLFKCKKKYIFDTNYLEIKMISAKHGWRCTFAQLLHWLVSFLIDVVFRRDFDVWQKILEMFHFLFAPFKVLIIYMQQHENVTVNSQFYLGNKNRFCGQVFFL